MADSRSLVGGIPVCWISISWVSRQLSLITVGKKNPGPCNSRTGSGSTLGEPNSDRGGPMARRSTVLGGRPVMMKPPIPTRSFTSTRSRVERLMALVVGVALGVGVGLGAIVGLGLGKMVAVGLGVGVVGGMVVVGVGVIGGMVVVGVAVGVGVVGGMVAVGVGETPQLQLPKMLNTMCMFGKPMAAVVVGVLIPQPAALR